MSKTVEPSKFLFTGGINSGTGGKLDIALTTDDGEVDSTKVTIDLSGSTAGAVWTMTVGTSTDTYTTAAVTSTSASKAVTVSTGTSTPATAITGGATGALTARSGNSVANHAGATGGVTGAFSAGSGNASSTLGTSGASGAVTLSSGTSEDAATGAVTIASGASTGTAAAASGALSLASGAVTGTSASGAASLMTGTSTYAGTGTAGASGALTVGTGNVDVTNASGTGGASGALTLSTGNSSSTAGSASGASGAIAITTGNSADSISGSISLTVGTAGTTRGNINLSATDVAVTGNLKTNDLAERGVDSGITLAPGTEIIGVPKTVKFTTGYNVADVAAFTVPAGETWLITDCWHLTTTSWDGNGTAQVGVTADADGFLALANASLVTTYDESGGITGWPTGSRGLQFTNRGVLLAVATDGYTRYYRAVAGTTILWDVTTGTSTQGVGTLYLTYIRLP